jgi:hypothetical protein
LASGPRFGVDGAFEHRLRLPYTLPEPVLDVAVERLAQAAEALERKTRPVSAPPPRRVAVY